MSGQAMRFTEAADLVKSSLDIVEVVSRFVVLKKSGRNYTGKCPFHNDKNPSMSVHREKNLFKCFSCGAGGDTLAFLMKIENKTYGEVIRDLADEQGISIVYEGQSQEQVEQKRNLKEKILDLNGKACAWFERQLRTGAAAPVREYLSGRDIDQDTIIRFQLGFAPPGWENLATYLNASVDYLKEAPDLLMTAGLANARQTNEHQENVGFYDRFRNRLIVPIFDDRGQPVGFGGRALSDEDNPKYLNSPETPVYLKSKVLYGLNLAKDAIRETRTAVVMEGYFDVISAHRAGVTQAVAACGTAMTEDHVKLLTRFGAETIYLSFDSDEAGLKAALSAVELIEPYLYRRAGELSVKVVVVPSGKDPDDYLRAEGAAGFEKLMEEAQHYLDFKCGMALRGLDTRVPEGRVTAAARLTPIFAAIPQPVLQSEYVRLYAERLGLSEEALQLEVKRHLNRGRSGTGYVNRNLQHYSGKRAISNRDRRSLKSKNTGITVTDNMSVLRSPLVPRHIAAERNLIRLMLLNTDSCHMILAWLDKRPDGVHFSHPIHQAVLDEVRRLSAACDSGSPTVERLIQQLTTVEEDNSAGNTDQVDRETLRRAVAEYALSAEELADQMELETLPPGQATDKILRAVERYHQLIEAHQAHERLNALNKQACKADEESASLSALEVQYQIRESLMNAHRPSTS